MYRPQDNENAAHLPALLDSKVGNQTARTAPVETARGPGCRRSAAPGVAVACF